jgi:hypothetical protein
LAVQIYSVLMRMQDVCGLPLRLGWGRAFPGPRRRGTGGTRQIPISKPGHRQKPRMETSIQASMAASEVLERKVVRLIRRGSGCG